MKKQGILNRRLNEAIAKMGHGDLMFIADAGFPIPEGKECVDLALKQDDPEISEVIELVLDELIYENIVVAEEQKMFNPNLYNKINSICDKCEVQTIPHDEILNSIPAKVKVFVRTGAFQPWGNVLIYSGINAHVWFDKPGVVVPDYYKERVDYIEKVR